MTDLDLRDKLTAMRRTLGLLLVLIQFGPLVGAGLCLHAASRPVEHCAIPMDGKVPDDLNPSRHNAPGDCALMPFCASSAPIVPQGVLQAFSTQLPTTTPFSIPGALLPGDPIAPPHPPPIA